MVEYSIVKAPRSGWLIDDGETGTSIRYPTKAAAAAQIAVWQRAEIHRAETDAEHHAARLVRVRGYLAARTLREAENAHA
jgi:hypothetical protein